jgi:hypothetical protein
VNDRNHALHLLSQQHNHAGALQQQQQQLQQQQMHQQQQNHPQHAQGMPGAYGVPLQPQMQQMQPQMYSTAPLGYVHPGMMQAQQQQLYQQQQLLQQQQYPGQYYAPSQSGQYPMQPGHPSMGYPMQAHTSQAAAYPTMQQVQAPAPAEAALRYVAPKRDWFAN